MNGLWQNVNMVEKGICPPCSGGGSKNAGKESENTRERKRKGDEQGTASKKPKIEKDPQDREEKRKNEKTLKWDGRWDTRAWRFSRFDRVVCRMGQVLWVPGTVAAVDEPNRDPEDSTSPNLPYVVKLDPPLARLISVPRDNSQTDILPLPALTGEQQTWRGATPRRWLVT